MLPFIALFASCPGKSLYWFWQKGEENGERAERRMLPKEWWLHLHVAGLYTGGGRGLLAICACLSFAEDQRDVGPW